MAQIKTEPPVEEATTWEPRRPRERGKVIHKYHQGCGHGRTPKGRK